MRNSPQQVKINLPAGFLSPVAVELFDVLNTGSAKALFVGGCVRDAVLGEVAHDIDLATTLTPDQTTAVLKQNNFKAEPTGLDHGTVMAIKGGEAYEVTTLRRDLRTDGRHAEVEFTDDFQADAARRDFTFNAMYMDKSGHITDFFNGLTDLESGTVRFVGDPAERLREDWLRALRYIRFYGRFSSQPPATDTFKALGSAAAEVQDLSAERITTEVLKAATTARAPAAFQLMADLGYLKALGLEMFSVAAFTAYHKAYPQTDIPLVVMVAGLWQADQAALLNSRHLRFSNKQKQLLKTLTPETLARLDTENIGFSCWLVGADNAAQLWRYAHVFGADKKTAAAAAEKAAKTRVPPFPLGGQDMLSLGFAKGPAMGEALRKTEAWWAEQGFPGKEDCLNFARQLAPDE